MYTRSAWKGLQIPVALLLVIFGFVLGIFVSPFVVPSSNGCVAVDRMDNSTSSIVSSSLDRTDACVMRSGRDPTDGRWFNYSSSTLPFYAYTAFYDDRPSLRPGPPVVRVIGVSHSLAHLRDTGLPISKLFCALHFVDIDRRVVVPIDHDPLPIGHGWNVGRELLHEYIFTCGGGLVSDKALPEMVSITMDAAEDVSPATFCGMPVERPIKPVKPPLDLGVCVQAAYDRLDALRLVEWFELQRLLGVSTVFVYDYNLDGSSLDVLRHYVGDGLVELRKTDKIAADGEQVRVGAIM